MKEKSDLIACRNTLQTNKDTIKLISVCDHRIEKITQEAVKHEQLEISSLLENAIMKSEDKKDLMRNLLSYQEVKITSLSYRYKVIVKHQDKVKSFEFLRKLLTVHVDRTRLFFMWTSIIFYSSRRRIQTTSGKLHSAEVSIIDSQTRHN